MTITDRERKASRGLAQERSAAGPTSAAAVPPKLRRRPVLVAGSAAAVLAGALISAYAYVSVGSAQEVLAVAVTVHRGELVEASDLTSVRVSVDPALRPIAAANLAQVVGQRAASDLVAGGLVTEGAILPTLVPASEQSLVGVGLPAGLMPGEPLQAGDQVRVVATPGEQGDVGSGKPWTIAATVVGLHPDPDSGRTVVSVQVPFDSAAELAARAATGKVAIVLDARER